MNFEKARLSQAEADHEVQGDRKYRRGEDKVVLQDITRKCKDVKRVADLIEMEKLENRGGNPRPFF